MNGDLCVIIFSNVILFTVFLVLDVYLDLHSSCFDIKFDLSYICVYFDKLYMFNHSINIILIRHKRIYSTHSSFSSLSFHFCMLISMPIIKSDLYNLCWDLSLYFNHFTVCFRLFSISFINYRSNLFSLIL